MPQGSLPVFVKGHSVGLLPVLTMPTPPKKNQTRAYFQGKSYFWGNTVILQLVCQQNAICNLQSWVCFISHWRTKANDVCCK